ncbi:MAG: hypothetical protein K8R68_10565, partial [Bacteroidales bacterium]|nr:hypothetical protein [Bacteroidales bacterium]
MDAIFTLLNLLKNNKNNSILISALVVLLPLFAFTSGHEKTINIIAIWVVFIGSLSPLLDAIERIVNMFNNK